MALQLKKSPQFKNTKYFCIIIDMEFFSKSVQQVLYIITIMRLNIYNLYILLYFLINKDNCFRQPMFVVHPQRI
jgi:hypothetical protein